MTALVFFGGVVFGIICTLGTIGLGQALAQRRREQELWKAFNAAQREHLERRQHHEVAIS